MTTDQKWEASVTTDQKFSQATGTIPIEVLRYSSDACRTVTWKWRAMH